ncbi:putative phage tail protein [Lacrimispora saccharolytica]|uniref:DUF2313 domain-containing protein n=1 Tax=Lacrimispora saccharolytica (strain ATCC 35040 / DSM 2544 / NRCC 2533 / WM1) TaxID=610130 RepID=D9R936_LACSW|nr:putative phage tail protein [Lacrimispora saccharolytica]ADL04011.1 conserved hypothetical protein [[Clostridium] saccharolyticum WM1]QRV21688.1 DUF2313 domain-containing protein [Lacrimispora saccharolytica]
MDLMALLPGFYDANETMIRLQSILSSETESLDTGLSQTISECFVSTASAMLSRYESIYGLEVDVSKSNMFRRERIKAKIAGAGTTTKQMIINTARSYSNGEVEVIEDNPNSRFTIKFVGTLGIPGNLTDLKLTIEEIKPAHLAVTYEYVYNTWGNVNALTWEQAETYTWEQIRTVNI